MNKKIKILFITVYIYINQQACKYIAIKYNDFSDNKFNIK